MTANKPMNLPLSASQLFLTAGTTVLPGLLGALVKSGPIRTVAVAASLRPGGITTVATDVATTATELMDVDLGQALVDGWCTYARLRAAGRASAERPGTQVPVELTFHKVSATYQPSLDILVDEQLVATVRMELKLLFAIDGFVAHVRTGRLVIVEIGRCRYAATIACEDAVFARREGELRALARVPLGEGVSLIDPPRRLVLPTPWAASRERIFQEPTQSIVRARTPRSTLRDAS